MDSHVKDKTVSPTVLSLTWESPYLGKTVFILRRGPVPPRCHVGRCVLITFKDPTPRLHAPGLTLSAAVRLCNLQSPTWNHHNVCPGLNNTVLHPTFHIEIQKEKKRVSALSLGLWGKVLQVEPGPLAWPKLRGLIKDGKLPEPHWACLRFHCDYIVTCLFEISENFTPW